MMFNGFTRFQIWCKTGWKIPAGLSLTIFLFSLTSSLHAGSWTAESVPAYDQRFQQTNGWIGADGDFTTALPDGSTVWLFSDTMVGRVQDGHREAATMVNNSAARQQGTDPVTADVKFFTGADAAGKPASLLKPADGRGWFWIFGATMADGKLFMFLPRLEHTAASSAFGFRQLGLTLGEVTNPLAAPTAWQVKQTEISFAKLTPEENLNFGSALFVTNGFVYVFGTRSLPKRAQQMILARAPEATLENFSSWQFRTGDGWSTNASDAANLCDHVASEYSVSWLPAARQYVLICTENGLSDKIMLRTAPQPWGPWNLATVIYRCPEVTWGGKVFCYAAKAHPMLARTPDELIVTYAANSYAFADLTRDARLYWPRFLRVKYHP